jgi:hypothetical protein
MDTRRAPGVRLFRRVWKGFELTLLNRFDLELCELLDPEVGAGWCNCVLGELWKCVVLNIH